MDGINWLRRLLTRPRRPKGGVIVGPGAGSDNIPMVLSPGCLITDPDEAEALGLTVEARWMREKGRAG